MRLPLVMDGRTWAPKRDFKPLGVGELPTSPSSYLVILPLHSSLATWHYKPLRLLGLSDRLNSHLVYELVPAGGLS